MLGTEVRTEVGAEVPGASASKEDGERFFLRRHRIVNAGAGTGKTHALLTQYLHLLSGLTVHGRPLEPRSICALTFTEKAAGEMRERLGRRLFLIVKALAEGDGHLAALLPIEPDLCESARARGRDLPALRHFESARAQLSTAPIGTFHSFAAGLLRRHAVAAALDPDFTLLDEDAAADLLEEQSERLVLSALEGQHGEELEALSAQLVAEYGFRGGAHAEGLVESLCRLYWARAEEGQGTAGLGAAYAPALLFDERQRLRSELGNGLRALLAMADELSGKSAERAAQLGAHAPALERLLGATARDDESLLQARALCEMLRPELSRLRAPKSKNGEGSGERLRSLCDNLKRATAEVTALYFSVRAAPLAQGLEQLLAVLIAAYDGHKRAAAALDFTDLLRRARDLLRDEPAVRVLEQRRYAALLIDEFQDTSPLQAEILRLLIGLDEVDDPDAGGLGPRRLYLVGDRKQSIYGFRGADVTAYERLCRQLLASGADEETLSVSRRSRPELLASINALFASVFKSSGDSQAAEVGAVSWDVARDPLRPIRESLGGPGPLVELLSSAETEGEADVPANQDALHRESRLLAQRIVALVATGVRYGDIVLLLRRFTHLLRYTAALKQAGIPHYVVRGRGFYQAQEVLDVAAFLTVLDDPEDRLALLAVLRSPLCGLSDESLARLHLLGTLALLPLLQETPPLPRDEGERLARLLGLLRALGRCGDRIGPAACILALLDATDYLGVLYADADGEQRVANVLRLCERARACEERGGNLRSFVRSLRKDTDPRLSEARSERDEPTAPIVSEAEDVVRVMTVHQAKGLEFPVVLLAGCGGTERTFAPAIAYDRVVGVGLKLYEGSERQPTLAALKVRELSKKRSAFESSRLFYVAATRAKERLIFAGEARRGRKAPAGTWLSYLQGETLRGTDPPLLVEWSPPPSGKTGAPAGNLSDLAQEEESLGKSAGEAATAERQVAAVYAAADAAKSGALGLGVTLGVAAAADLLVCGRRFHLRHTLYLSPQEPHAAPGRDEDLPGAVPLGTLAAELLCELEPMPDLSTDLATDLAHEVKTQLSLRGQDVRSLAMTELGTRLTRFLQSSYVVRELSARRKGREILRALPYDVAVSATAAAPRLRGVLELVIVDAAEAGAKAVRVMDYRYGYAPEDGGGGSPLLRARRGLLGLVARQVFQERRDDSPDAAESRTVIRIGACYLRDADPQPRFEGTPSANELDEVAAALLNAVPLSQLGPAAALRLPVLPLKDCRQLGCGYQFLCHKSSPG